MLLNWKYGCRLKTNKRKKILEAIHILSSYPLLKRRERYEFVNIILFSVTSKTKKQKKNDIERFPFSLTFGWLLWCACNLTQMNIFTLVHDFQVWNYLPNSKGSNGRMKKNEYNNRNGLALFRHQNKQYKERTKLLKSVLLHFAHCVSIGHRTLNIPSESSTIIFHMWAQFYNSFRISFYI